MKTAVVGAWVGGAAAALNRSTTPKNKFKARDSRVHVAQENLEMVILYMFIYLS